MSEQPNLFEIQHDEGYPKAMRGMWLGKYPAYAPCVDTPEQELELVEMGYTVIEKSNA